jgi:hypothetical protein
VAAVIGENWPATEGDRLSSGTLQVRLWCAYHRILYHKECLEAPTTSVSASCERFHDSVEYFCNGVDEQPALSLEQVPYSRSREGK